MILPRCGRCLDILTGLTRASSPVLILPRLRRRDPAVPRTEPGRPGSSGGRRVTGLASAGFLLPALPGTLVPGASAGLACGFRRRWGARVRR